MSQPRIHNFVSNDRFLRAPPGYVPELPLDPGAGATQGALMRLHHPRAAACGVGVQLLNAVPLALLCGFLPSGFMSLGTLPSRYDWAPHGPRASRTWVQTPWACTCYAIDDGRSLVFCTRGGAYAQHRLPEPESLGSCPSYPLLERAVNILFAIQLVPLTMAGTLLMPDRP
eukprot:3830892-Amphidinium_carterae.1